MDKFVSWLHCWNRYNVQHDSVFLSKEAYIALTHTDSTFVILIRDLMQHNVLKSILTGKFQTDQLDSSFGHYRQLSGSNYLVTVSDGLRCEKKLRVKRLLKLYSASKGTISIRTYLERFNDIQPGKICTQFLKTFPYDTIDILCVKEDDLSPLLLISGYVARKTMEKADCSSCKAMFGSLEKPFNMDINPEHFTYFDSSSTFLMFPSNFFNIILCGYCIFNFCISNELESRCLALEYQKHTLIGTMEHYIVNNDKYS